MSIAENIRQINENINGAVKRRKSEIIATGSAVKMIAVTKTQEIPAIEDAINCGAAFIGENKVQEALIKAPVIGNKAEWHLIGHLQTNKVRQAIDLFELIHSVDSERLAAEIDKTAAKQGKVQDILLQVNVADETSKFGIAPKELASLAQFTETLKNVRVLGLMTIAPFLEDPDKLRPVFKEMYQLFKMLQEMSLKRAEVKWLSMGMTNDYIAAIEEGANMVRIGTAIFGARNY